MVRQKQTFKKTLTTKSKPKTSTRRTRTRKKKEAAIPQESSPTECANCLAALGEYEYTSSLQINLSDYTVYEALEFAFLNKENTTFNAEAIGAITKPKLGLCTSCTLTLRNALNFLVQFLADTSPQSYVARLRQQAGRKADTSSTLKSINQNHTGVSLNMENILPDCKVETDSHDPSVLQNLQLLEHTVRSTSQVEFHQRSSPPPSPLWSDEECAPTDKAVTSKKTNMVCNICTLSFVSRSQLHKHRKHFHPELMKSPVLIGRQFSEEDKELLKTTEFKCSNKKCDGVWFPTFRDWVIHQNFVHFPRFPYHVTEDGPTKPFDGFLRPCPRCGVTKSNNHDLLMHIKIVHLKQHLFSCPTCQKNFKSSVALRFHTRSQHDNGTGDLRSFLCTLCGSNFKTKSYLRMHERTHYGEIEKSFRCDICSSTYLSNSRLQFHKISVHSEERPFKCSICGKTFKLNSQLRAHNQISHVKKYATDEVCELCGKAYGLKTRLKDHLMSFHKMSKEEARISAKIRAPALFRILPNGDRIIPEKPTKPKSCIICGRTYVRREGLFTHLISVHGKSEAESKEITGLETIRNLLGKGNRKRKSSVQVEPDPVDVQRDIQGNVYFYS